MVRNILLVFGLALLASAFIAAEEPDAVYKQGIAKLRDAQSDHAALVPAVKLLAQAAALYEAAADEAKVAEVNSCLYWAKKKMTLADTDPLSMDAVAVQRIVAVAKAVPSDQAQAMFDKADAFAKTHAADPLLVAIRYFEVADRFKDSDAGRKAMELSLKAMQQVGERAKLETYKPAPTDGKAFIKSEPAGAAIILVTADGGKMDTGKVTPALVQLPVGKQTLELTLKGHKAATLAVEVDGRAIAKPEAPNIEPLAIPIDVIFEPGWIVFVDGKPAKAVGADKAETPCTAELPLGKHEIGLAKEGFLDLRQQVEVLEGGIKTGQATQITQMELKTRPMKGTSTLLNSIQAVPLMAAVYLDDLKEEQSEVWRGVLGKHGKWADAERTYDISVKGKVLLHGLLTHPMQDTNKALVAYKLDGQYRFLQGAVAVNDSVGESDKPLTFHVLGDEKVLWKSKPVKRSREPQEFLIAVPGVKELALVVTGGSVRAHAVWVDPMLCMGYGTARPAAAKTEPAVNLLPLIEPSRDSVRGKWQMQKDGLACGKGRSLIEIPYQPPEEYDFRISFTRLHGEFQVVQLMVRSGKPFEWVMGSGIGGLRFGFESVHGKRMDNGGSATLDREPLKNGQRYTAEVRVRSGGVSAFLDGKLILEHKTDYSEMSRASEYDLRDNSLLGLFAWDNPTVFHSVEVIEITGRGKKTR